jgi:hypothetical protein
VQNPGRAFLDQLDAIVAAQPTNVRALYAVIYNQLLNDASSEITDSDYAAIEDLGCGIVCNQEGAILGFGVRALRCARCGMIDVVRAMIGPAVPTDATLIFQMMSKASLAPLFGTLDARGLFTSIALEKPVAR